MEFSKNAATTFYYAIIRTCIQTSIFVSTSSCTSSCQCGTSVSTSPCSLGLTSLSKTIRKVPFLMAHIDPFLPVVRGVKVPDSNTMESDTALCTDEYTGTITTGTNVKCFAFNSFYYVDGCSIDGRCWFMDLACHVRWWWTWLSCPISKLLVPLIVPCLTVFVFRVLCLLLLLPDLSILQCMRQVHTILLHGHSLQPCRRCAICRFTVR